MSIVHSRARPMRARTSKSLRKGVGVETKTQFKTNDHNCFVVFHDTFHRLKSHETIYRADFQSVPKSNPKRTSYADFWRGGEFGKRDFYVLRSIHGQTTILFDNVRWNFHHFSHYFVLWIHLFTTGHRFVQPATRFITFDQ